MSSTVPNPASPDPVDHPNRPPTTRREAASAWSAATTSTGWSGALIAMGVVSVVLGVIVLVWPKATLLVVAITFGLQLIVAGAVRLSVSRDLPADPGWLKPVSMVLGVLSIIAGIICLFRPGTSLVVIAIFIAAGWIAEGVAALAQGFGSDRSTGARVFLIVSGVVSVLAGLVVAIFPGSSLVLLARIAGIMLILIGLAELVTAFMARRAAGTGAGTGSTATPTPA
ncbi:HdeD family acid-resistance protein [Terrabacter carboxydivorans]|uniref:Acid-resistance membrane protein n=1 Tax=Terrabacter carboxydivorans TaxID=619730 RepID=A0ABN3M8J9_9MICO